MPSSHLCLPVLAGEAEGSPAPARPVGEAPVWIRGCTRAGPLHRQMSLPRETTVYCHAQPRTWPSYGIFGSWACLVTFSSWFWTASGGRPPPLDSRAPRRAPRPSLHLLRSSFSGSPFSTPASPQSPVLHWGSDRSNAWRNGRPKQPRTAGGSWGSERLVFKARKTSLDQSPEGKAEDLEQLWPVGWTCRRGRLTAGKAL